MAKDRYGKMIDEGSVVLCLQAISPGWGGPNPKELFRVMSTNEGSIGISIPRDRMFKQQYSVDISTGAKPNWGGTNFVLVNNVKLAKLLYGIYE